MVGLFSSQSKFFTIFQHLPKRSATLLSIIALAACASSPPQPSAAHSGERQLFVESSEDIIEFHLKPVLPDQLAIDGLSRLATVDAALSLERTAEYVTLRRD